MRDEKKTQPSPHVRWKNKLPSHVGRKKIFPYMGKKKIAWPKAGPKACQSTSPSDITCNESQRMFSINVFVCNFYQKYALNRSISAVFVQIFQSPKGANPLQTPHPSSFIKFVLYNKCYQIYTQNRIIVTPFLKSPN